MTQATRVEAEVAEDGVNPKTNPETGIVRGADEVNIIAAVQSIIDKAITPDSVAAMEKLLSLQEHQQDRNAKKLWAQKFARVRARTKTLNFTNIVPKNDGGVKFRTLPIEDMQDAVEPIIREEGLELKFNTRREGPNSTIVIGICTIMDPETGHEESTECGFNSTNAMGGDLGASKSARRGALIAFLAIRVRADQDAGMLGDLINLEQIAKLQSRVSALRVDERKFLAYALSCEPKNVQPDQKQGFEDFWKKIRQGRLFQLHGYLTKLEAEKAGGGAATGSTPPQTVESAPQGNVPGTTTGTASPEPIAKPAKAEDKIAPNAKSPTATPEATDPKTVAKIWVEHTPEAELLQILSDNPRQTAAAKKQANVSGFLEEFDSKDLKRVAYCWKLARITETK